MAVIAELIARALRARRRRRGAAPRWRDDVDRALPEVPDRRIAVRTESRRDRRHAARTSVGAATARCSRAPSPAARLRSDAQRSRAIGLRTRLRRGQMIGVVRPRQCSIVALGVVDRVVQAAALLAADRRQDDQLGDHRDVAQLDQVAGDEEVPVVAASISSCSSLDALQRAGQAAVRADDADVVPHEAADLVPVLGDDDRLVAVGGAGRVPGRQRRRRASRSARDQRRPACSAARWPKHQRLEQRVRRQAVGAVQAGHRDLAGGVEAADGGGAVARSVTTPPQQ